jgi:peptide deformylase
MIHELVDKHHPILKTELEKFDFQNPPTDPIQLAHDLAETMLDKGGVGIAANQIGLPYRAFAMLAEQIIVCFNPILLSASDDSIVLEEGCLSQPNLFVKIKRPQHIRVRYTEPNGNVITEKFGGMTARIFQHELDHLNGMLYTKRANKIHLDQARKNAKKGITIPKISNETRIIMNQMSSGL